MLWAGLLAAAAVALCFVPLFNLLGYESSLVLAGLASLSAVRQGVRAVTRLRERAAPGGGASDGEPGRPPRSGEPRARIAPLRTVLGAYVQALAGSLAMLVVPLLVLLVNGLRVRNCSYLAGLGFFVMLPVLSAAAAAALGVACGLVTARARAGLFLGYAVVIGSLLWAGWRFLATPAVYAYDPFFGYFPGTLYDEDVAIGPAMFYARAGHALWALGALLLCAVCLVSERGDPARARLAGLRREHARGRGPLLLLALGVLGGAGLLWRAGGTLGVYTDTAALESHLSGRRDTPHFVLRYRPGDAVSREIELYAREHELRYAQLRELLGVEPTWRAGLLARLLRLDTHDPSERAERAGGAPRVVSYLFDSAQEKRRWMGAAQTYVAKPWRREIYMQHEAWPHPVLRHELAHVFFGAAGDPIAHLAMRGVLPHIALVEGAAVAADWRGGGVGGVLDGHQAVQAMREARTGRSSADPSPEEMLAQLFGGGGLSFWRYSSGRAYTVAGSFVRYLLDKRGGPGPLLAIYRSGGAPAAFVRAYGAPAGQLIADWARFLDTLPMPAADGDRAAVRERMRRPAVFGKVCAHEQALRTAQAATAIAAGDLNGALRLIDKVCADDPGEPLYAIKRTDVLWLAGRYAEAAQSARALLGGDTLTPVLQAHAESLLGDVAAARGDLDEADRRYAAAAERPLDESSSRLCTAKRLALQTERDKPGAGRRILAVLIGADVPAAARPESAAVPARLVGPGGGGRSDAVNVLALTEASALAPELGLPPYLLGRLLYQRGGHAEAEAALARAVQLGLPDARFVWQAELMRAQAALLVEDDAGAAAALGRLRAALGPAEGGKAAELTDWLDRAARWRGLAETAASGAR